MPTILVTGGAGFIGGHFIRLLIAETDLHVVNLDKLTYAGRCESLGDARDAPRHTLVQGDIVDAALVERLLFDHRPTAIVHLAAETHVDRSIDAPDAFAYSNLLGTSILLRCALDYWEALPASERDAFRFIHVSTDEVFGDLPEEALPFSETSPYRPSSPYSASKAGSDHMVRAFHRTYGLPTIVTNSSNNYGPGQALEKLIPLVALNALGCQPLPVYGDGRQQRDWLWVQDQAAALLAALLRGKPGESYNIGGDNERTNLDVVQSVCDEVDRLCANTHADSCRQLIQHVEDRPGHDRRYAIDSSKAKRDLGWTPRKPWKEGLAETVAWYAANAARLTAGGTVSSDRLGLRKSMP